MAALVVAAGVGVLAAVVDVGPAIAHLVMSTGGGFRGRGGGFWCGLGYLGSCWTVTWHIESG